ncbi:hypothetical protein H6F98_06705 [Microcoleus sp. FACHB-SPT15]|uniref:hypothetical protein n=1 Tax=Microcoleus sp. FACHB-SPT15 TaxID=2692830 RepID=UPI00177C70A6|nr:hypothetical protein [Microcoleus sp. FACHB-SPT15]MBD1805139.1 hypothetical protein [Microcoleus sp. FACHB-SPT15]
MSLFWWLLAVIAFWMDEGTVQSLNRAVELTLCWMNRAQFSVSASALTPPLQSHLCKARGTSQESVRPISPAMFRYALPYISNLKKLVLWYLVLKGFTRTKLFCTEPPT